MTFLEAFGTAFIPILVAMDAIGVIPFYISLTDGVKQEQKRSVLYHAVLTAGIVGVAFIVLGKGVFQFLGITVQDFMVAGGLILFMLAVSDLLFSGKYRQRPGDTIGVVPLGMPLIVGPAVLTALVVQTELVGIWATLSAFAVNLFITFLIFSSANPIVRVLRKGGTQAISKVANLLLAAIGVMIVRKGVLEIVATL